MTDPLIYVDRSEVRDGRLEELKVAIRELAELVEHGEEQLVSYAAFLDVDGRHMTVIHVHDGAASLEAHARVAGPAFPRFAALVRLQRIDVYGSPSDFAIGELRRKAELLGGAVVEVHPLQAGFIRGPSR